MMKLLCSLHLPLYAGASHLSHPDGGRWFRPPPLLQAILMKNA